jgi:hypothetical protein
LPVASTVDVGVAVIAVAMIMLISFTCAISVLIELKVLKVYARR